MLLLAAHAFAADIMLRNDTNLTDEYDKRDQVAWLSFPECAISVLTGDAADLPIDIGTVFVYLGTNTGNDDGVATFSEVGIQRLDEGSAPTIGGMDWGPEVFSMTVSSTTINALDLVDSTNGWSALPYTTGSVAVWVCPPDPTTGESWPFNGAADQSGIIIDNDSPNTGSYLFDGEKIVPLSVHADGAWVIRASVEDADIGDADTDTDTDSDTDADSDTDTDTDTDTNLSVSSVTPADTVVGEAVSIAILGTGFEAGLQLYVGGLAASGVSLSGDTAIAATSPSALPAGVHDVMVTNADGGSSTLAGAFTVTEEAGACGCAAATAAASAWGLLAAAGLVARRRFSVG